MQFDNVAITITLTITNFKILVMQKACLHASLRDTILTVQVETHQGIWAISV